MGNSQSGGQDGQETVCRAGQMLVDGECKDKPAPTQLGGRRRRRKKSRRKKSRSKRRKKSRRKRKKSRRRR